MESKECSSYHTNVLYNGLLFWKPGKLRARSSCVTDTFSTAVSGFNSMKHNIRMNSPRLSLNLSVNKHLLWNFSRNADCYSHSASVNKSELSRGVKMTRKIQQPRFLYSKKTLLIFLWLSANWVTQCKTASSHLSRRDLAVRHVRMYMCARTHNHRHCGSISIAKWLVTFYQGLLSFQDISRILPIEVWTRLPHTLTVQHPMQRIMANNRLTWTRRKE